MKTLLRLLTCLIIVAASVYTCFSQATQGSDARSLAPELRKFEPFIGQYTLDTLKYLKEPEEKLNGTIEFKSSADGYQVAAIFRHPQENGSSEAGWLIKWNQKKRAYHVKHSINSPKESTVDEGYYTFKFKGGDLLLERLSYESAGKRKLLRFRWTLITPIGLSQIS